VVYVQYFLSFSLKSHKNINRIADSLRKKITRKSNQPLEPQVQEEFDSTRTQRLMIRDPVVSYAGRIKAFENGIFQEGPDAFTLLTGERGTGKSSSLVQIVQFCRERDWIVLYANDCREWSQLQKSWEVSDVRLDKVTFDQPEYASNLLQGFLDAHRDKLETIPVTRVEPSREDTENLADYILEGLEKRGDDDTLDPDGVLIGVMDELNHLTDHKVRVFTLSITSHKNIVAHSKINTGSHRSRRI